MFRASVVVKFSYLDKSQDCFKETSCVVIPRQGEYVMTKGILFIVEQVIHQSDFDKLHIFLKQVNHKK